MTYQYKLAASLICGNPVSLGDDVREVELGGMDAIHFDVMDGVFVPRLGFYPELLKSVKGMSNLPVDVHLMIEDPVRFLPVFAEAGGDILVVHAESTKHLHYTIKRIKELGARAGVALNPATPLSVLDYVLEDIDLVMLMAINPGIVGHKLIPSMIGKIADLKEKIKDYPQIVIEVDGGVSAASAADMIRAGANLLVCGTSCVFKQEKSLSESAKGFRELIDRELAKDIHGS
jgi:ribulose-phosphate 3-epimerase